MKNRTYFFMIVIMYISIYTSNIAKEEIITEKIPFSYEVNKNLIKSREGMLKVKDKYYIEIKELSRILGIESIYQNDILSIKKKEKEAYLTKAINEAIITDIDLSERTLTVMENVEQDKEKKTLVIQISKDTSIEYPVLSKKLPLDVLKKGMKVAIQYKDQLIEEKISHEALYIELLENNFSKGRLIPTIENAYIIEINKDREYIIVATVLEGKLDPNKQIIVYVDHHTNIKHRKNKVSITLDELKLYQRVTIITNGIMTNSAPIQTVGLEIIVQ